MPSKFQLKASYYYYYYLLLFVYFCFVFGPWLQCRIKVGAIDAASLSPLLK